MSDQPEEILQVDIKEENLRFVLKKTILDAITAEVKADRGEHLKPLLDEYERSGTKAFSVILPDGTKIGNVTLAEGKDATVVKDQTAFFLWMKERYPEEIETIEIPAQIVPASSYEQVKPAAFNRLLEHEVFVERDGMVVTQDGELVEGAEYRKAPAPDKFSVTYAGTKAADKERTKQKLFDAYRNGDLGHLNLGVALPQIERHQDAA